MIKRFLLSMANKINKHYGVKDLNLDINGVIRFWDSYYEPVTIHEQREAGKLNTLKIELREIRLR